MTPPRHSTRFRDSRRATTLRADERATMVELAGGGLRVAGCVRGTGPTVMMLHGWGGSARDMGPIADAIANAGFRVVTFDMPGHGHSSGRESSLVHFLRAVRLVTEAAGEPEVVVGHSFGGTTAAFAITELGIPARAAVLLAPAPGPAYFAERFARTVGLPLERARGMLQRVVDRVGRSAESLDAIVAARGARVPALVLHDPADREVPWKYATALSEAWPGSRLVPRPGVGHRRILRDRESLAAVVEFVTAHAGPIAQPRIA